VADSLKLCIMIHVEDGADWGDESLSKTDPAHLSQRLFRLATQVGAAVGSGGAARGAKLSVQFGSGFLDGNTIGPSRYVGPSSLRGILAQGGNFWSHGHDASYNGLVSRHSLVLSAFDHERVGATSTMGAPFGRSGGTDLENPTDWVSIGVAYGLRWRNSTAMTNHSMMDIASRPYQLSNADLNERYFHGPAPGPLYPAIQTMRLRPFWARTATNWFAQVGGAWDNVTVDSLLIIPQPGDADLAGLADKASMDVETLTDEDLKAGLTQVWSTFQLWTANSHSISGAWYTQIHPEYIDDVTIPLIGAWVDSINALLQVNGSTKFGVWKNMNEIASTFVHSAYL